MPRKITLISFQRGQFFLIISCHIYFLKLLHQNTMFLVTYPCSQPTSDIPVNTAPSPTSQTCSQTARHQEKLAHHCLPHFSALWVFIKLGNQGKPAYIKQPIRSPYPAVVLASLNQTLGKRGRFDYSFSLSPTLS